MRLALFQPDIPQNVGAAIRLTACLGVPLDVIEPCGFPLSDQAIRRSALDYGTVATVQRHDSWTRFLEHPARQEGRLILFTTKSAEKFPGFSFQPGDTLLFGRESAGAPQEVHDAAQARLFIPIIGRSLNLVSSSSMALGEALRQTGGFPSLGD